ncbi:Lrp/AsnC family transcriptional regulator [Robbsia sp. Bb-Pol-6]|uniref:Lrp/AsnC family transcriptional regulator n=1 Tax=Robbsia betulipollinis TaxID=2981849 RepID=A0ABT3ZMU2_9BURK|nr:Lrp/AsnC family transcriptional regulator [Robbsia betulipollinis]MCY0387826.1 Lrp/AsnC family transcriptional regulator [Robbsia betulipollinis]
MRFDATDRRILELLQMDASMPLAELAQHVHLTQTPCWKRVQRLKRSGVIRRQVTLCDPTALGVGTTVFVSLRTAQHSAEWSERFSALVATVPEVVEVYRMTGDRDYLLRLAVGGIDDYDRVYHTLIQSIQLHDVTSNFAMEQVKYSTALPVREN